MEVCITWCRLFMWNLFWLNVEKKINLEQIKKFKSEVDGLEFIYQIVDGNLTYKIEGTDWQDFILEDKRAYSDYEYKEFVSLLEGN